MKNWNWIVNQLYLEKTLENLKKKKQRIEHILHLAEFTLTLQSIQLWQRKQIYSHLK